MSHNPEKVSGRNTDYSALQHCPGDKPQSRCCCLHVVSLIPPGMTRFTVIYSNEAVSRDSSISFSYFCLFHTDRRKQK